MSRGLDWPKILAGWGWSYGATMPNAIECRHIQDCLNALASSEEDISMGILSSLKTDAQLTADGFTIPFREILRTAYTSFVEHSESRVLNYSDKKGFFFELPIAIQVRGTYELRYLKLRINKNDLKMIGSLSEAKMSYHISDNYKGGGICLV